MIGRSIRKQVLDTLDGNLLEQERLAGAQEAKQSKGLFALAARGDQRRKAAHGRPEGLLLCRRFRWIAQPLRQVIEALTEAGTIALLQEIHVFRGEDQPL